jgi:3-oxoacyl-[acyl-carrier protein] reductase
VSTQANAKPSGKIALVTGGSRGIGRSIVLALARTGYRVHFSYRRDAAAAAETVRLAAEIDAHAQGAQVDVTRPQDVEAWVQGAADRDGGIEVLVNNAGEACDVLLAFQEEDVWNRMIAVNLDGVRHACKAVLRPMIGARRGAIVNVASLSAVGGREGQTAYAAAKGGVLSLTRCLAREVAAWGIRVNAVVPGPVSTEMMDLLSQEKRESLLRTIPLRRAARPEEVAAAVAYLASDRAAYVTGASLKVDGGLGIEPENLEPRNRRRGP